MSTIIIGTAWIILTIIILIVVQRAGQFLPSDTPTDYPKRKR